MVFASKAAFFYLFCLDINFFIKKFGFFLVVIEKSCTFVLS